MKKKIKIISVVTLIHLALFFVGVSNEKTVIQNEVKIPIKTSMNFSQKSKPILSTKEEIKEKPAEKIKEVIEPVVKPKKQVKKLVKKPVKKIVEKTYKNPPKEVKQSEVEESEQVVVEHTKSHSVETKELYNYVGETYVAESSKGIDYKILKELNPEYPQRLKKMLGRNEIIIKTKFLVDKDGKVSKIEFIGQNNRLLQQEVEKALKRWLFKPMFYKNKPLEVYFYKEFKFT
ncbi:MAG: energy transducer TonB [Fusobacteriaceae bacterium]